MLQPLLKQSPKCLGLIGSASASDVEIYWSTLRKEGEKILGPGNSAEMVVHCLPTEMLRSGLANEEWDSLVPALVAAGRRLVHFGAEALVICGSALNPAAPQLREKLNVPVVDLGLSIRAKLQSLRYHRVAILGIRTAQEQDMWRTRLAGIDLIFPTDEDARWLINRANAAIAGHAPAVEWKIETNRIVSDLRRGGAQVIVLAEPNLGRWIRPGDSLLYPLDAAEIHAWMAGVWALHDLETAPPCIISA